ncbi:hypothetical protein BKA61DRAFT_202011 [Leptodontidium sp. MPI-SDFR-AT-0119]|nr:hypothetical protein BKA61DRAFT_202011 [Leptodontidium sp. MPI-SDFR-AT-0119]
MLLASDIPLSLSLSLSLSTSVIVISILPISTPPISKAGTSRHDAKANPMHHRVPYGYTPLCQPNASPSPITPLSKQTEHHPASTRRAEFIWV